MEVIVNRLTSTIEVAPETALLDPAVLRAIVDAVGAELAARDATAVWEARERSARPVERR